MSDQPSGAVPGLVSVLIPNYNGSRYLHECLRSIICQTYAHLEILVVDDGSTDNSVDVIRSYCDLDPRVTLFRHHNCTNRGLAASLNLLCSKASGQYIARIDSDDIASPDRIEKQLGILNQTNSDICGSNILYIDHNSKSLNSSSSFPTDHRSITNSLQFICPIAHPSILMRTCILNCIPSPPYAEAITNDYPEDYDLWVRLAITGARFSSSPESLTYYRITPSQMSQSRRTLRLSNFAQIQKRYLKSLYPDALCNEQLFLSAISSMDACSKLRNETLKTFARNHLFRSSYESRILRLFFHIKSPPTGWKFYLIFCYLRVLLSPVYRLLKLHPRVISSLPLSTSS